jgi:superfamily I DNA/RNA helicase
MGKTVVALEAARRLAAEGKQVLFLCFNRLLMEQIRGTVASEGLAGRIAVGTYQEYMRERLMAAGHATPVPEEPAAMAQYFAHDLPNQFFVAFFDDPGPRADALIVDEGQDLAIREAFVDTLDLMVKGEMGAGRWLWFEDDQQAIYRPPDAMPVDVGKKFKPVRWRLSRNFRNTKKIVDCAQALSALTLPPCENNGGEEVRTISYRTKKEQWQALQKVVAELLDGGVRPSDIIVLSEHAFEKSVMAGRGHVGKLALRPFDPRVPASDAHLDACSVHEFKGLERKVVILADVEKMDDKHKMLHYVGTTRATELLVVLLAEGAPTPDARSSAGDAGLRPHAGPDGRGTP